MQDVKSQDDWDGGTVMGQIYKSATIKNERYHPDYYSRWYHYPY